MKIVLKFCNTKTMGKVKNKMLHGLETSGITSLFANNSTLHVADIIGLENKILLLIR